MDPMDGRAVDREPRDAAVDAWLREHVVPVYDAMKADPARGLSVRDTFDSIRARHAARIAARA